MVPNTNQDRGKNTPRGHRRITRHSTAKARPTSSHLVSSPQSRNTCSHPPARDGMARRCSTSLHGKQSQRGQRSFPKTRTANETRGSLLSHGPMVVIPLQRLFLLVQLYEVTALSVSHCLVWPSGADSSLLSYPATYGVS